MEKTKNCPYCGEEIMADARKCKHCGEWLDEGFVQEQDSGASKRESETDAKPKQNGSAVVPQSGLLKETSPIKKNKKWLLAVIPIVVLMVCAGLYLGGVFGHDQLGGKRLRANDNNEKGLKSSEEEIQAEIYRQVREAYNKGAIYELMTPEFKAADEAAGEAESMFGDIFHDADIFYNTQDELPDVVEVSDVELVEENKAYVKVLLKFDYDWGNRIDSTMLVMVRDNLAFDSKNAKWLVDDVISFYYNNGSVASYSQKAAMKQFVDEAYGARAYIDDEYAAPDNIYFEEDEHGNEVRVVVDDYGNETRYPAYMEIDFDDDYQDEVDVDDGYLGDYQSTSYGQPIITKEKSSMVTQSNTVDENAEKEIVDRKIYQTVEEMPAFPGGEQKLMEFVAKNIKYPQTARETGVEGRVIVGFVIEPDGSISNVTLLKGVGGGCDEEAVRVIKSLPKWEPGKEQGKAVRVSYQIPVSFRLQ